MWRTLPKDAIIEAEPAQSLLEKFNRPLEDRSGYTNDRGDYRDIIHKSIRRTCPKEAPGIRIGIAGISNPQPH